MRIKFLSIFLIIFMATTSSCQNQNIDFEHQNTLSTASSPYLLEHADNPVHWHEWGPEALALAKKLNRPIIVSIGYAACHWCHVMADQSFMDKGVAEIMNNHFVCIKVDREERPDIDQIYMNAVQLISGRGGWPLNAFALPDGRPFYAGTYYTKQQWIQLLTQIRNVYKMDHAKVVQQAESITQGIRKNEVITAPASSNSQFDLTDFKESFKVWNQYVDQQKGGTINAPKFPLPVGWEYLLQYHYYTQDSQALNYVETTLDAMAKGGIYDQIGGGFARYSTDENWFAPHFEKMLYDNGQLLSLYAHAYQVTKNTLYAQVIRETITFCQRELKHQNEGFYSSLNADSEGEEGKYYVWKYNDIKAAIPEDQFKILEDFYGLKPAGNWEESNNILHQFMSLDKLVKKYNLKEDVLQKKIAEANQTLFRIREKRIRPTTDTKILSAWNGLMIKGLVDSYWALGEPSYLSQAEATAHFFMDKMILSNGKILRNFKDGKASISGFLEDYALMADAFISLYQASFDMDYLNQAKQLTIYAIDQFEDAQSSMFYYTSKEDATALVARKMELSDNVIPSSNGVMAMVLYKLGLYYEKDEWVLKSKKMLNQMASQIEQGGPYYAQWSQLMALQVHPSLEVAILGKEAQKNSAKLMQKYHPHLLLSGGVVEDLPLLKNRFVKAKDLFYICRDHVCNLPVEEVQKAEKLLRQ